jgi:hypothetical protein
MATAEVLAAFDATGVETLLLKGRALAVLLYRPDEQRDYSDADLLVPPSQLSAAEVALATLGYANADAPLGIDDVGGVVHGQTWIRTAPADEMMIDLHSWMPGARVAPELAWDSFGVRRTQVEVAGRPVAVLDRGGQAMHLAVHAAQHGPAFAKHLDELALALERWPAEVWDAAARLAREVDATQAFAAGLRLLPQGASEALRLGLPATDELDWAIRHAATRPRGTFHVRALAEADGWGERLRILRRSLLPRRAWIVHEHPWAGDGSMRLVAGYVLHLAMAPVWAARAWRFARRASRSGPRP